MAGGFGLIPGANTKIEVQMKGQTAWTNIPFVADISASGGDAPTSEVLTYQAVGQITGSKRPETLTFAVPSYIATLPVNKDIRSASVDQENRNFRITTNEGTPAFTASSSPGATLGSVAVAADGVVTFSGANMPSMRDFNLIAIGQVIETGTAQYQIIDIQPGSGSQLPRVTVEAPASAVTATPGYQIVTPAIRLGPFLAGVTVAGSFDIPVEGAMSSTVTLAPVSVLPEWDFA